MAPAVRRLVPALPAGQDDNSCVLRFALTLRNCVIEARPQVLGIHLIRFAAGAALVPAAAAHGNALRVVTGAFSWEAAIFAGYVFNGVSDRHGDRLNGSRRPIAAGLLSPAVAAGWVLAAAALAVAAAAWTGIVAVGSVLAVLVLGWLYSAGPFALKRRPAGTALVGGSMGLLAYLDGFGSRAAGTGWAHPGAAALIFAAAMSAWMAFVGAPAKDLPDVPGDRAAGRRTLPVRYGAAATRRVVAVGAVLVAIGLIATAVLVTPLLRWPAAAMAVCAVAIVLVCVAQAAPQERAGSRLPYEIFMFAQYAVNGCLLAAIAL